MTEKANDFVLSDLEAWILETIDNIGWYAYLWFPVIYREVLNFGSDATDGEVYESFGTLIRKGALVQLPEEKPGDAPQWKPNQKALDVAKDILSSKFGFPQTYSPPKPR